MINDGLKIFLDEKADYYNNPDFIIDDPISIPHQFDLLQDIEISAFLTATISWGNRKSIIQSASKMMQLMDYAPYDYIMNFTEKDLKHIPQKSLHRTFLQCDFIFFIKSLQRLYQEHRSMESWFALQNNEENFYHSIERFRAVFLSDKSNDRAKKHLSSTYKNSSAKRLNMFLRWMIRKDNRGVDFGIWKNLDARFLSIPLDVHTGNISRKLNLITRKQNDWKSVIELDNLLRKLDPKDPAKYDFALFGLGVEKII